jgi:hypothetical protein
VTPDLTADEIRTARDDFHRLVDGATTGELRRRSNGTRWTNDQLLFHMLFGYLLVCTLVWLVRGFSVLPPGVSRGFARALNAVTGPFHAVNYLGSLGGARVLGHGGMEAVMDRVTARLVRTLDHATERQLARGMYFPVGWDPYFRDFMTIRDLLHYATQHYDHHRRQLTLSGVDNA